MAPKFVFIIALFVTLYIEGSCGQTGNCSYQYCSHTMTYVCGSGGLVGLPCVVHSTAEPIQVRWYHGEMDPDDADELNITAGGRYTVVESNKTSAQEDYEICGDGWNIFWLNFSYTDEGDSGLYWCRIVIGGHTPLEFSEPWTLENTTSNNTTACEPGQILTDSKCVGQITTTPILQSTTLSAQSNFTSVVGTTPEAQILVTTNCSLQTASASSAVGTLAVIMVPVVIILIVQMYHFYLQLRKRTTVQAMTPPELKLGSQEEQEKKQRLLKNAALYITEGEKDNVFYRHPEDKLGVLSFYIIHHPVYHFTHLICTLLLMLLALIERPSVLAIDEEELLLIHALLEIFLLLFLTVDVILRAIWLRMKFLTHRTVLVTLLLVVMFIEAFVVIHNHQNHFRVSRAFRPLFFIDSYLMSEIRRILRNIGKCLREILDVLLILLFVIAVFALMGYYLFAQSDPDYFSTVGQSYISLFITLTTANHPDVMIEAYKSDGSSALFFIIFLVITLYLLTNVLLGVVYGSFTHASKEKFKKTLMHKWEALKAAYDELTENGHALNFDTFFKLMLEYKPLLPKWKALCTFKAMQRINTRRKNICIQQSSIGSDPYSTATVKELPTKKLSVEELPVEELTLEDFYNLYEALDFKWTPPNSDHLPSLARHLKTCQKFCSTCLKSRLFDIFLTLVVIANALFLIIYTALRVPNADQRYEVLHEVLWVSFLFLAVYCIEAIFKMFALGWKYFTKPRNLVDLVIIITSLVMLSLEINCNFYILLFFRPMKLLRLLLLKRRYRKIIKVLIFLKQQIISAIVLLVVVYYFFAIVGMEAFPAVVQHKCCDYNHTWYGVGEYYSGTNSTITTNVYWVLNFDSILKSFTTLFVLMVINNWYIVMEGFAAEVYQQTTNVHYAWLTRLYFMSFYIMTLVVLQVNVAFIVDAFANAQKIKNALSKNSTSDQNYHSNHTKSKMGEFASKENLCWRCICQCTKTSCKDNNNKIDKSIVNAFYDPLKINLSCKEVEELAELPPASWWEKIAHYIRVWRGVDFDSCEVIYKAELDTAGEYKEKQYNARLNEGYICEGKRNKSHCFNIQLYSNEIPEWEKEFDGEKRKEGRPIGMKNCGDLLVSVLCKKETSIEETRVPSDRSQLHHRTVKFLKGFLNFIFE